jgi:hypothetical protein
MKPATVDVITLSNGDIVVWTIEDTSVHIKCITKHGDPVELNAEEVKELCSVLTKLAERLE